MAAQIAFLEYLPSLAIAMARLYPCFFLIPAFCFEHVRGMPRHVIVFALALIPAPGIYHALSGVNYTLLALGGLMLKEAMLGFLLGMLLSKSRRGLRLILGLSSAMVTYPCPSQLGDCRGLRYSRQGPCMFHGRR